MAYLSCGHYGGEGQSSKISYGVRYEELTNCCYLQKGNQKDYRMPEKERNEGEKRNAQIWRLTVDSITMSMKQSLCRETKSMAKKRFPCKIRPT